MTRAELKGLCERAATGGDPDADLAVIRASRTAIPKLIGQVETLRKALGPFAKITRSSFYDKGECETYTVVLSSTLGSKDDFTGQDIESARTALDTTKE